MDWGSDALQHFPSEKEDKRLIRGLTNQLKNQTMYKRFDSE